MNLDTESLVTIYYIVESGCLLMKVEMSETVRFSWSFAEKPIDWIIGDL